MATPAWPESLNALANRGSWTVKAKPSNARTDMERGPARVRRRFTKSMSETTFSIAMDGLEFEVFRAFVQDDLMDGSRWFTMPVFIGSDYMPATRVRFKNSEEPYSASDTGFNSVQVAMELEMRGTGVGVVLDGAAVLMLGLYGADFTVHFCDQLQQLVNVDLLDALGSSLI